MAQSQKAIDGGKIPGPVEVPNIVWIRQVFALGDLKFASNFFYGHYPSAAPPLQSAAQALFTSLSTAWSSNLGSLMHPTTRFIRVELHDMQSHTNPVFIGTGAAVPGTGTGNALPAEMAVCLTENVDVRGRGAKGRVYIAGWTVAQSDTNGSIVPAVQTAMNQYGIAVMNAINAQGLSPALAKPARQQYEGITGTLHPARGPSYANVTSMVCLNLSWDSQRRRGLK